MDLLSLPSLLSSESLESLESSESLYGQGEEHEDSRCPISVLQVKKLQAILKPMMLRRLKDDVEKNLAPKEETIIEVRTSEASRLLGSPSVMLWC